MEKIKQDNRIAYTEEIGEGKDAFLGIVYIEKKYWVFSFVIENGLVDYTRQGNFRFYISRKEYSDERLEEYAEKIKENSRRLFGLYRRCEKENDFQIFRNKLFFIFKDYGIRGDYYDGISTHDDVRVYNISNHR